MVGKTILHYRILKEIGKGLAVIPFYIDAVKKILADLGRIVVWWCRTHTSREPANACLQLRRAISVHAEGKTT